MLLLINVLLGIGLLFFGRQLFWLFVAAAGFLTGVSIVTRFWHGPEVWQIIVGLLFGVVFAYLAVALRAIAIGVAGFLLGGAGLLALANGFGINRGELIIYIVGGILGVMLIAYFFNWALIGISSFAGASILVKALALEKPLAFVLFIVLLLLGIYVQTRRPLPPEHTANA